MTESLDLAAAKRLLDHAKDSGFRFERTAPGPDGPLRGVRETDQWHDEIYLSGSPTPAAPSADAAGR